MNESEHFQTWAILELMGHRKIAGLVTEQTLAGATVLRVDIPDQDDKMFTQFYGGPAIYCLTPVREDVARAFAAKSRPAPVYIYELQLPAPRRSGNWPEEDSDEERNHEDDDNEEHNDQDDENENILKKPHGDDDDQ